MTQRQITETRLRTLEQIEGAAREIRALIGGKGPGQWTYAGRRITDEAAAPLISLVDYLNEYDYYEGGYDALERGA